MTKFRSSIGVALILVLYGFLLEPTGFRLKHYYTPDGTIVLSDQETLSRQIHEINGLTVLRVPPLFKSAEPVLVTSNLGTGYMQTRVNSFYDLFFDLFIFIFLSIAFFIVGSWFLESGNDVHLAALPFTLCLFFFTLTVVLAEHQLHFLWQLATFAIAPALLNLGLRTTGKDISGYLLIAEILYVIFLGLMAYVSQDSPATALNLRTFATYSALISCLLCALMQMQAALSRAEETIGRIKNAGMALGILLGPGAILILLLFSVPAQRLLFPSLLGLLFFLATLVYGTYRLNLVPYQFVLTRSIVAALLTIFFMFIYSIALLGHSILLPAGTPGQQWIVNIVFILSLALFLDPARRSLTSILEGRVLRLNSDLTESLEKLSGMIATPAPIQAQVRFFTQELKNILQIDRVHLILGSDLFRDFSQQRDDIIRLSSRSSYWKYLRPGKIVVTNYLTFGSGSRGDLYRFLIAHGASMAIRIGDTLPFRTIKDLYRPPDSPHAVILIGHRKRRFKMREIRYLQEVARLAGLLAYNFQILIDEIEKRKRIRDVLLAGQMQRSLSRLPKKIQAVKLSFFSQPVISVTGDYLDIFQTNPESLYVFLGDVSGHGLGTGYLVSAIRSLVRSHLESKASLTETMDALNGFLANRYKGNEFITLFAMHLHLPSGRMEYINAAHPAPLLCRKDQRDFLTLRSSQRLLGILPEAYLSSFTTLMPEDRLFLYSDGVIEAFNPAEVPLGEAAFVDFMKDVSREDLYAIGSLLQKKLLSWRSGAAQSDDTTFVALEYTGSYARSRSLFSLFRQE
ncbi:MAG: serine/threonine-protein phosphatase [Spirochaetales bacterium]|nr:serine/threonine-protein phosphatase [Spirochaetales bacterium]